MSVDSSSACHSPTHSFMQCIPVATYFAAKVHCESINSKLRHGMAQHGMALHGQESDTHTVSELGCQDKVTNSLSSVAVVFGP